MRIRVLAAAPAPSDRSRPATAASSSRMSLCRHGQSSRSSRAAYRRVPILERGPRLCAYRLSLDNDWMTTQDEKSVADYVSSLDDAQTAQDTETLITMMRRISGHEPKLWNVG